MYDCFHGDRYFLLDGVINGVTEVLLEFYLLVKDPEGNVLEESQNVLLAVDVLAKSFDVNQSVVLGQWYFGLVAAVFGAALRLSLFFDHFLQSEESSRENVFEYYLINLARFEVLNSIDEAHRRF